jgi:hypothetical protein
MSRVFHLCMARQSQLVLVAVCKVRYARAGRSRSIPCALAGAEASMDPLVSVES